MNKISTGRKKVEDSFRVDHMYHGYIVRKFYVQVLELRGAELLIYAIIHSFSENNEGGGVFFGTVQYLCDISGVSRSSALRALKSLREKNLIFSNKTPSKNKSLMAYRANLRKEEVLIREYLSSLESLGASGRPYLPLVPFDRYTRPEEPFSASAASLDDYEIVE